MGVYIKGMEMPKSCYACMFFAQTDYWNKEDEADILSHCKRTGEKTWESVKGYLPNCPLVPVPPHGMTVVRGKWEYNPGDNIPYCSECMMPQDSECNFCPNCGADMRIPLKES